MSANAEIATILASAEAGDRSSMDRLLPLVYDDLRRLARRYMSMEPAEVTLQPTALVNEAYLKLADQTRVTWKGRSHFMAVSAQAMRRILVDHARKRRRKKRGGGRTLLSLSEEIALGANRTEEDVLDLDWALKRLAEVNERHAAIVEMRVFGGLTSEEVAEHLGVSRRTVTREWTGAKAWLRRELSA